MRASLGWIAVASGLLWACGTSDSGNQQRQGQDGVPETSDPESGLLGGDADTSRGEDLLAPADQVDSHPEDTLDPDVSDSSEWHSEDYFGSMGLGITLIPSSNEDLPVLYDSVKLALFDGAIPCSAFGAVTSDTASPLMEMTVSSIGAWVVFESLDFNGTYTVVVRVVRDEGGDPRVVAWGCADQIVAPPGVIRTGKAHAQVALQMVVLESGGSYEYFEEYVLDETVIGQALTPILASLESLFADPGAQFLGFLDAQLFPSLVGVSDEAYLVFLEEVRDAVTSLLVTVPTPFPIDPHSLKKALLNPRFEGTLELVQEGATVVASGTMQSLVLVWDFNGQPQVWVKPLAVPPGDEPSSFGWTGQVHDATQLDVNASGIGLNLGAILFEFVFSEVFPAATGRSTPAALLNSTFDCVTIAATLSGEALSGVGLSPEGFLDSCVVALGQMEEAIEAPLGTATTNVTLYRWGTCVLSEAYGSVEDHDLVVDLLTQGVWSGESLLEAALAPLSGTFGAARVPAN